jgi:outer membrane receptor protein involved in Fe transport
VRLHTTEPVPVWTLEPSVRLVAPQRRVAGTFLERETSSFAIVDLRGTWQPNRSLLVFTGIENLADTFYREHLDLRTGRGTFQPGINVYGGVSVTY